MDEFVVERELTGFIARNFDAGKFALMLVEDGLRLRNAALSSAASKCSAAST
jgi:hypothetical protein